MIEKNLNLINIPPFVLNDLRKKNLSFFGKVLLILKGKVLSYAVNNYSGKTLCNIINFYYGDNGKIYYKNCMYYKNVFNSKFYYPNSRFLRIVNDENILINIINESYCLNFINFSNNDIIIDCGANVGELKLALNQKVDQINYYAFEPDKTIFKCLEINCSENVKNLFNVGLSDSNNKRSLFIDSEGGNSSFIDFGSGQTEDVESITLDSLNLKEHIKLFKVEAEGFEPEVLVGSKNTLERVEYVSVDFGSERGKDQSNTVTEVNKFLYDNNFSLVSFSNFRTVGLYKNNKIFKNN